jgi:hypothetical protein
MEPAVERIGVMVIRIWTEDSGRELRARLTRTLDISTTQDRSEAVVGPEGVCAAVGRFIEEFLDAGAEA